MRVKNGTVHQGNPCFGDFSGMQCTAMAYTALILAFLGHVPLQYWNSDVVDSILQEGNALYTNVIDSSFSSTPRYLMHRELPNDVSLGSSTVHAVNYLDMFYGYITNRRIGSLQTDCVMTNDLSTPFHQSIEHCFLISNYILLTIESQTVGLFASQNHFYIFDSHSRSLHGMPCENGGAALIQFENQDQLISFIERNNNNARFEMTPVVFEDTSVFNMEPHYSNSEAVYNSHYTFPKTMYDRKGGKKKKAGNVKMLDNIVTGNTHTMDFCETGKFYTPLIQNISNHYTPNVTEIHTHDLYTFDDTFDNSINNETGMSINESPCKRVNKNYRKRKMYSLQTTQLTPLVSRNHSYSVVGDFSIRQETFLNAQEKKYFEQIQQIPNHECSSCRQFLFQSQTTTVNVENEWTNLAGIHMGDILCSNCRYYFSIAQKIPPACEKYNSLCVAPIPDILKEFNPLEKRFIAKLHTFMTLLVLPKGGQYAEKGLAIHFPVQLQEIINVFPNLETVNNFVPVIRPAESEPRSSNTDAAATTESTTTIQADSYVNMEKILCGLIWLKANNPLFANIVIKKPQNVNVDLNLDFDDTMTEMNSIPCDYNLPIIDNEKYISDGKLVLPKCDEDPVYLKDIAFGEEMAFPWLFTNGCNGLTHRREIRMTMKKYFQYRLYHSDARWRKDISYLLVAINMCEQEQLLNSVNFVMRLRRSGQSSNMLSNADVTNLQQNPDILDNSYMFAKTIRGTAAYWKNTLMNLLAMLKCLGPPTLFLTLSANDNHWPELAMMYTGLPLEEINDPNLQDNIRADPLLAAVHFERRWNALLQVLKDMKPFGEMEDYFARVEFQNRGSPHLHIFIWLKSSPNLKEDRHEDIVNFIDGIISTTLPDKNDDPHLYELVSSLQHHQHTFTCRKGRRQLCRFGFPYKCLQNTHILNNIDITQTRGRFYETARDKNSLFINAYNPVILKLWKANMDIQVVGGSTGAAYYVCSYLCKAEPDDLKLAMEKLVQSFETENLTQRMRLLKLGSVMLKTRKLSAQEAAFRLSKLKLIHSSREVYFLNTFCKSKRMKKLKPKTVRENLPNESTDIFEPNMIDYYHARPIGLESWTLFAFVSWFTVVKKSTTALQTQVLCEPYDHLIVRTRIKPRVIRVTSFKFDSPDYYHSFLLLHIAHRNEDSLLLCDNVLNSPREAFTKKQQLFDTSRVPYQWHTEDIESQITRIRLSRDELAESMLLQSHEYDAGDDDVAAQEFGFMAHIQNDRFDIFPEQPSVNASDLHNDEATFHNLITANVSEHEVLQSIQQLNADQMKVFDAIRTHFSHTSDREPLRLFVTGGGGVGKSFLLRVITNWLRLATFLRPGSNPVLVAAPTGIAARNVNGLTLHTLLSLPVQHGYEPGYENVSPITLKKLRDRFAGVHTLIIDEISMVSYKVFSFVDRRLGSITDCSSSSFGKLSVIVFGDYYQLRPVRGHFAFKNPLWHEFQPYFLDTNVRQIKDPVYADLLKRVRLAQVTQEDLDLLKTRLVFVDNPEMLHLYPLVRQVNKYNSQQQKKIAKVSVVISAIHIFSDYDAHSGQIAPPEYIPQDDRDAGGLPNILTLSHGSRVMLLRNIMTEQGLVNSAIGFVESVEFDDADQPLAVYVLFDDPSVGRIFKRSDKNNAIPIYVYSQTYRYDGRSINRIQFPLMLSWACTVHKTQGTSLSQAVISLGNEVFGAGQAYVALSRVQTLDGVFLESFCPEKIRVNKDVEEEYARLRNLKK